MNINATLLELGNILGFKDLAFAENGDLTLSFDNIVVTIDYFHDNFFYFTRLGDLPLNKAEAYELLLNANNFGALGAYVGLDQAQKAITLTSKIDTRYVDAQYLADILEKHINSAEALIQSLQEIEVFGEKNTSDAVTDESNLQMMLKI